MQADAEGIVRNVAELSYFMRGGATYHDILYDMSIPERDIMHDFVTERIGAEMQKADHSHPVY